MCPFILGCSVYSAAQNISEVSCEEVKFLFQITVKHAGTVGRGTCTYTYHVNIIIPSIARSSN
jgi:hypothetical protein